MNVSVYDPIANKEEVKSEYNIDSINELPDYKFDAIILSVAHDEFKYLNYKKIKRKESNYL